MSKNELVVGNISFGNAPERSKEPAVSLEERLTLASLQTMVKFTRRNRIYNAANGERDYQDKRWGGREHELECWFTYMRSYIREAEELLSRNDKDAVLPQVQDILRKLIALGVACAEQHGIRERTVAPKGTYVTNGIGETKLDTSKPVFVSGINVVPSND